MLMTTLLDDHHAGDVDDHGVVVNDPHDDDNSKCDQNNIQEKCDDDFSVGFNFCGHKADCPDLVKPIACIIQCTIYS